MAYYLIMYTMIADFMEKGFLENIIDMFRQDKTLYWTIPLLMSDDRVRVRLGAVALVEAMRELHAEEIKHIIPGIAELLKDPDPTIRADAAYLMGITGQIEAISHLKQAENDENDQVRQIIREAISDILE